MKHFEGKIVVTGNIEPSQNTDYLKIAKLTPDLNSTIWDYTYTEYEGRGKSVIQTSDGGYLVAGSVMYDNIPSALIMETVLLLGRR